MSDEPIRCREGWQQGDAAFVKILWPIVTVIAAAFVIGYIFCYFLFV